MKSYFTLKLFCKDKKILLREKTAAAAVKRFLSLLARPKVYYGNLR